MNIQNLIEQLEPVDNQQDYEVIVKVDIDNIPAYDDLKNESLSLSIKEVEWDHNDKKVIIHVPE